MPVATIIDTLDRHQGASTAILTAALVLVTIYYTAQNRAMVKEMKRARDAALLPALALDFYRLGPAVVNLAIKNVGPGAALDVDVRVVWDPLVGDRGPEHRWRRNLMSPGEQVEFFPPGDGLNDNLNLLPKTYRRVRLSGSMKDAAGNVHIVCESFEDLAEWREVLGRARQRYVTADPDRRVAEELHRKFERPLRDLREGLDGITRGLASLAEDTVDDTRPEA